MPLTAEQVKKAAPRDRDYKLQDERAMYLLVRPNGSKLWRLKFRISGREKTASLGAYPDVPLAKARELREEARRVIAAGGDPSANKQAAKRAALSTFETVAREYLSTNATKWTPRTLETKKRRLEMHAFAYIGKKPIRDVSSADLLAVLRRIEKAETLHTAGRVRQLCSEVFRFAIATGSAENDPTFALRGALAPMQTVHHAAITDPKKLGTLLRIIDDCAGMTLVVRAALQLLPLTFVRPGELRHAEWTEIDFERNEWTIPKWKMKTRAQSHTVPLSTQAVAILSDLREVSGHGRWVFPGRGDRCMSENTANAALLRLGIGADEHTPHGFRATARTLLDEVLGFRPEWIEHQLAHAVKDPLGTAYNRAKFLAERATMLQKWADYLDSLKAADRAKLAQKGVSA